MQRLELTAFWSSRALNGELGVLASKFKSQQELQDNTKTLLTKGSDLVIACKIDTDRRREITEPSDGVPWGGGGRQPPKWKSACRELAGKL